MIRFLINRPIAVLVSFIALVLLGAVASFKLPISLLPQSEIPSITVKFKVPNYSVQESEQMLVSPLRNAFVQLSGLADLESTNSESGGIIKLWFNHGTDISKSFIEANEKMDMVINLLPRDIDRPQIVKTDIADIPIFRLNIYPKDSLALNILEISDFTRDIIRRRLEQLPEVGMVDISGFTRSRIELIPKSNYLKSIDIEEDILINSLINSQVNLGSILVKDGHYQYFLKLPTGINDLNSIKDLPLNIKGRIFRLSDLANIEMREEKDIGKYFTKGKQAINLAIIKQPSARVGDLKSSFYDLVTRMRLDYPNINFDITQDQTFLLDYSISNLLQDLLLGGILATGFILIFFKETRTAFLIGITIPITLIISQLGFFLLNISINIISLGGMILGLSMIIDNTIVVADAISNYRNKNLSVTDAIVKGTNEVIRPMLTSMLTNCAVFIPLIFISGLAGVIFFEQAVSIVIGLITSLIVAVLLFPTLYKLTCKTHFKNTPDSPKPKVLAIITKWYESGLRFTFRFPSLVFAAILILFCLGGGVILNIEKDKLPKLSKTDFELYIDWNEPIGLQENQSRIEKISLSFAKEVEELNAWVGNHEYVLPFMSQMDYSQSLIYFKVNNFKKVSILKASLLEYIKKSHPHALIKFEESNNAFDEVFSDNKPLLRVKVSDKSTRKMPSKEMMENLSETILTELPYSRINSIAVQDNLIIEIDHWQVARYQVSLNNIIEKLQRSLNFQKIGSIQGPTSNLPIIIPGESKGALNKTLSELFIVNEKKEEIPISTFIKIKKITDYKVVTAGIEGEYYPLNINTSNPGRDLDKLQKIIKDSKLETTIDGNYFDNIKLIKEMSFTLLISILLLYFILAAQFESLIQPLFMLFELPFAICGSIILLYLVGSSINLMSMIGIVIMSGLIINDSILKIDAINQLRRNGVPLMEAIIEGGNRRLRSIVMISLTSIGTLLPTLFMRDLGSELQKPLALALIGGMVIGLFVSLFFVPLIYWMAYRKEEK